MRNRSVICQKLRLAEDVGKKELKIAYEKQKQTYELIILSSTDATVKKIAEQKLREWKELGVKEELEGISISTPESDAYEDVIRAAYRLLEHRGAKEEELSEMLEKLHQTKQTAENFYLCTLIHLEKNNGYPGCASAKYTIESALNLDPGNEAYLALKKGIDAVIQANKEYQEEQMRIRQEALVRQAEEQKEAERRARRERNCELCGEGFTCTCGIIGVLLECLCGCMGCMDDCC